MSTAREKKRGKQLKLKNALREIVGILLNFSHNVVSVLDFK